MNRQMYRSLSGGVAGVVTLLGVFGILALITGGASWLLLDTAPDAERAQAVTVCGVVSLVVACAATGWIAARVSGCVTTRQGFRHGLLTTIIGLIVLTMLLWLALRKSADFYSVGVALGWIEIPEEVLRLPDVPLAPSFETPPVAPLEVEPPHQARERTIDTLIYVIALFLMASGAGALGGVAGVEHPEQPRPASKIGAGEAVSRRGAHTINR